MSPPPADYDLLYRRFAGEAGLPFATVGAMLDLEVASLAIGIHVIRNG